MLRKVREDRAHQEQQDREKERAREKEKKANTTESGSDEDSANKGLSDLRDKIRQLQVQVVHLDNP